jgi:hypothetical protein
MDDHLKNLLEDSFSPKSLFLAFRNDLKSLLDMLLDLQQILLNMAAMQ